MGTKYVKLFEHWLLEAEEMAINNKFSASQPQKTPVLLTTIEDFNTVKDEQLANFFKRLFRRAKQEEGAEKFDPKPASAEKLEVELIKTLELESEGTDSNNLFDVDDRNDNIERIAEHFGIDEKEAQILMERIIINLFPTNRTLPVTHKIKAYGLPKGVKNANDTRRFLNFDEKLTAVYKIVDPNAGCDVYFGPTRLSSKTYGEGNGIIEKGLGFIFCIKDGKLIFENYNQCNIGQLLAFIQKNMSPDDTDILDADGNARYLEYCAKLFGKESEGSSALVAKWFPTKVGEKTLQLISDETPVEKGGKGVEMPLLVANKVIGSCGFDFAKANLKESSKETLASPDLWNILKNAKTTIEIVGHTDGAGSKDFNQKLSADRAKSVLEYFKTLSDEFTKINPSVKITTVGKGFSEMVEDDNKGKNAEIAAKNRRVVILVDGKGPDYNAIYK